MKILVNKFEGAICKDRNCGATIPVGAKIKWYSRGKVYGIGCHEKGNQYSGSTEAVSMMFVTNSGAEIYQNSRGRCEDAPCCGCCN